MNFVHPEKEKQTLETIKEVKENYIPTRIFNEQLLFTQLGITLYQNNRNFRDIQIRKMKNDYQSSIFVHISTNKKYAHNIETEEFRKSLEMIETAIFQDETMVAVALHPKTHINNDMYHLYEYPVGEELLLFNSILADDMYWNDNSDKNENDSLGTDSSLISLDSFEIPEEWNICTESIKYENRYWCMSPMNCNYIKSKEDQIRQLFYTVMNEQYKEVFNKDITVCYRVIFQHPALHNYIKEPRIYIMEVNQIHKAESVDDKTHIIQIPIEECNVLKHIQTLSSTDEMRQTIQIPKYLGQSKYLLPIWRKSIGLPTNMYGIQALKSTNHQQRIIYNPLHVFQKYAYRSSVCLSNQCKKLQKCIQHIKQSNPQKPKIPPSTKPIKFKSQIAL